MKRILLTVFVVLTLVVSIGNLTNPTKANAAAHVTHVYDLRDHLGSWASASGPKPDGGPNSPPAGVCECIFGPGGVRVCGCSQDHEISCVPGGIECTVP